LTEPCLWLSMGTGPRGGTDRGMSVSGVRQRAGPSQGASRPVFDLATAKLLRPVVRPETICRSSLIERLARDDSRPIVSVVAPAGYGKTTLLSQWAERNGHAFAWVSVDEKDNDPKVLLAYVAEALDAVEPVGERVFEALASPASSVPGSVVPRLGTAFSSMASPVTLVLDDVHLLTNSECRAALSVLADYVPAGSRLVLAGRAQPPLRVARLRAEGRLVEIGPDDLSLTREEASALLRAAQVALGEQNSPEARRAGSPGGGGYATARAMAAFYQMLLQGGQLGGTRILSPRTIAYVTRNYTGDRVDAYMGMPMHRGLGPHLRGTTETIRGLGSLASPRTFGHGGVGSSYCWADPDSGVSFAYLSNSRVPDPWHSARLDRVSNLVHASII